jgi:NitT/TauT family transport system permease protein
MASRNVVARADIDTISRSAAATAAFGARVRRAARSMVLPLLAPAAILLAWAVVSQLQIFPTYIVPPFTSVLQALRDLVQSGEILHDITASLGRVAGGILLGIAIGVPMGFAIGWFRPLERCFEPMLHVLRQIPPIAWIPFALVWFKGGIGSAMFVVFIGAFFPILVNTMMGVRNASQGLLEVGYTMGCSQRQLLTKIVLPASVPFIMSGIRISMGIGWACVVAAEFFGYKYGLGALISTSYQILRMDRMIVGMAFIGLVGLAMDKAFRSLEARLFRWKGQ